MEVMLEGSYRLSSSELRADESKTGRIATVVFLLKQRMFMNIVGINDLFSGVTALPLLAKQRNNKRCSRLLEQVQT